MKYIDLKLLYLLPLKNFKIYYTGKENWFGLPLVTTIYLPNK